MCVRGRERAMSVMGFGEWDRKLIGRKSKRGVNDSKREVIGSESA